MSEPDNAVFVMPRGPAEWSGAAALWVTVAGWAEAARQRFGSAWVVTPETVAEPGAVLDYTRPSEPAPAATTLAVPRGERYRLVPVPARTAAKDLLRARTASAFRDAGEPLEWRDSSLAFVWQHHDFFHRAGEPIARRHGVPLVSYVHAPQVWEARRWGVARRGWGRALERFGEQPQLAASDVVACVSAEVGDELIRLGVPHDRILVSPMAVDATRFSPDVSGARFREALGLGDAFVVGWVGSFRGFHGLDSLVEAFALLRKSDPEARLLLGGSGAELSRVRDLVTRLGIADAVVLPGAIAHLDMPEFLAAIDVAVVSAVPGAGFHYSPIKMREYLACERAVVAPRLGELPHTVVEGEEALLYEPGDVADLAAQLVRVRDDPELRTVLGARGRELMLATSTWDIRLSELLAFPAFNHSERR